MDPISIKITFEDLPVSLQNSIIIFFNITCVLLVSITIALYLCIFNYIYKNYYKNYSVRLP
jgi:hypothetical protein